MEFKTGDVVKFKDQAPKYKGLYLGYKRLILQNIMLVVFKTETKKKYPNLPDNHEKTGLLYFKPQGTDDLISYPLEAFEHATKPPIE